MKRMLINATQPEEIRVAIVDGQRLDDLDIEHQAREQKKSNIYKGKITRVEPSLEAAFVDYGSERHGFLPFKEIARSYLSGAAAGESGRPNFRDGLKEGQEVVVQIEKEERGNKGAALTTFVSLAGRYLVLMPNNPRAGGVSRRIEGDDRNELREALRSLQIPDGMGVIVRTAGVGRTGEELQWDMDYQVEIWRAITLAAEDRPAPFLIYQESNVIVRALRDYFRSDIGEILIDEPGVHTQAREFIERCMPHNARKLKQYTDDVPLFNRYQIEQQIESAFQREVRLPSGGAIVIDHTEALISIDINSARATKGADIEETATHTNLEAADEIARQLRLRDNGGLIVIDFIDMMAKKNQRAVEERLREALKMDRARVQIGRISRFGLLEMSRQRLRPSLGESSQIVCPRCSGHGTIRSIESLALAVLRLTEEEAMKDNTTRVLAQLPVDVATFLLNEKRDNIAEIESRNGVHILLVPNLALETPHYRLERIRSSDADHDSHAKTSYELADAVDAPYTPEEPSAQPPGEQAAVKGITPESPAPTPRSPAAEKPAQQGGQSRGGSRRPSEEPAKDSNGGVIGWLRNLFVGSDETAATDDQAELRPNRNRKQAQQSQGQNQGRGRGQQRDQDRKQGRDQNRDQSRERGQAQKRRPARGQSQPRDENQAAGGRRDGQRNNQRDGQRDDSGRRRQGQNQGQQNQGQSPERDREQHRGKARDQQHSEETDTTVEASGTPDGGRGAPRERQRAPRRGGRDEAQAEQRAAEAAANSGENASEGTDTASDGNDDNQEQRSRRRSRRGGRRRRGGNRSEAAGEGAEAQARGENASDNADDQSDGDAGSKTSGAQAASDRGATDGRPGPDSREPADESAPDNRAAPSNADQTAPAMPRAAGGNISRRQPSQLRNSVRSLAERDPPTAPAARAAVAATASAAADSETAPPASAPTAGDADPSAAPATGDVAVGDPDADRATTETAASESAATGAERPPAAGDIATQAAAPAADSAESAADETAAPAASDPAHSGGASDGSASDGSDSDTAQSDGGDDRQNPPQAANADADSGEPAAGAAAVGQHANADKSAIAEQSGGVEAASSQAASPPQTGTAPAEAKTEAAAYDDIPADRIPADDAPADAEPSGTAATFDTEDEEPAAAAPQVAAEAETQAAAPESGGAAVDEAGDAAGDRATQASATVEEVPAPTEADEAVDSTADAPTGGDDAQDAEACETAEAAATRRGGRDDSGEVGT